MFRKFSQIVVWFLIVLVLSSCAAAVQYPIINPGDVVPVANGSTIFGLNQALAESKDTFILAKDAVLTNGTVVKNGLNMFGWAMRGSQGWGFAVFDTTTNAFSSTLGSMKANLVSGKDMDTLVQYLKGLGWGPIPASFVPQALRTAIVDAAAASAGSQSWLMIARVPVFMIVFDDGLPLYDPHGVISPIKQ